MNDARFADEIRERERVRRRREMLWNAASVAFHVALVAAIVWMTPARSLIAERKKKNPAEHLPPERIEQISDALSQARVNELLRQLEALKAVLHNMDLMKEQLQRDYDAFAGESAEDVKQAMLRELDVAEAAQKAALAEQAPVIGKVERMFAEEGLDLMDEERSRWLQHTAEYLVREDGENVFSGEIFNSAIEDLSDVVCPEHDERIKKVKDLSAAAVLVNAITAAVVGLLVFLPKLIALCL